MDDLYPTDEAMARRERVTAVWEALVGIADEVESMWEDWPTGEEQAGEIGRLCALREAVEACCRQAWRVDGVER